MLDSPYLRDIRDQPRTLQGVLDRAIDPEGRRFLGRVTDFDRIVLTGMGASLFAAYPTFLSLGRAQLPVWWIESGELLHQIPQLVTADTLVWVISQSGRSAEVLALLDRLPRPVPAILATTNDPGSSLGAAADYVLPLLVPTETAVSTRTYVNTLAVQQLAVEAILKRPKDHYLADAPAKLYAYLGDWRDRLTELGDVLNETRRLLLVGRGSSYATAAVGALVIKEAAKFHAEGMTAGQFRHGPFELADRDLTVVLIDGNEGTASLTEGLAKDLSRLGARALWMGRDSVDSAWNVPTPDVWGIARPIGEIVPVQLMSVTLAVANGHEAGTFRHLQKVTVTE